MRFELRHVVSMGNKHAPFDKLRACPERSRTGQALSKAEWVAHPTPECNLIHSAGFLDLLSFRPESQRELGRSGGICFE